MPSFVAECPRGHKGNFVTHDGYHHCFCGLHIPVFAEEIEGPYTQPTSKKVFLDMLPEEQEKLMEQYIQEGIAERVEYAIETALQEEIGEGYSHHLSRYQDRLREIDPEWNEAMEIRL